MAAYKIKTNMAEAELVNLMDKESWMTAEEAVKNGFCDRIMTSQNSNNQNSDSSLGIKNLRPIVLNATNIIDRDTIEKIRNTIQPIPNSENNVLPKEPIVANKEEHFLNKNIKEEGNSNMEGQNTSIQITNVQELRAAYPTLTDQLINDSVNVAVTNERSRLQEIDNIAKNLSEDIVNDAKYSNPVTAETLALQALKANDAIGNTVLKNMVKDIEESGANEVTATANSGLHDSSEELKANSKEKVSALAKAFAKKK
jgi:hypothetical protein